MTQEVVNCFQICIFVLGNTTILEYTQALIEL